MPHKRSADRRNKTHRRDTAFAEALEARQLLSAVTTPLAVPADFSAAFQAGSTSPQGFSASQIETAYGINNVSFTTSTTTAGTGAGQTIAIIAAYDDPKFVDSSNTTAFASSDLHKFDVAMDIADPPSFTKYDETGGTNYPPVDPSASSTSNWETEIALDVEWSHALAPQANIVLVEANSVSPTDLISNAAHFAATLPNVSVISMSFSIAEFSYESNYDSYLETPPSHQGITYVAASGDTGNGGGYPAMSPNVVAVGDTSLTLNSSGDYSSETGQSDSGGGVSQYETKPTYQSNIDFSESFRANPDVAFDGNPNTGVSVYDSYNGGSAPWYKIGGTSYSAPAWAALIAIADQGRVKIGLGTLDGETQTLPRLYALNSSDFHDITSGNNGNPAGTGYDLVTGLGTPIANKLIPDLAGGNTVAGTVFNDANSNGTQGSGESGLANVVTFVDLAHSGVLSGADVNATSSSTGAYSLDDLPGGSYRIRETTPSGATLTAPSNYYTLTLGYGTTLSNEDFGYHSNGTAQKLVFAQQPSNAQVGAVISPAFTVEVEDALGTLLSDDNSTITLSLASGAGSLGGTVTANAVDGIATFSNVTLSASGLATIRASDGTLTSVISNAIDISAVSTVPLVAAKLVFEQEPTATTAGNIITPPVTVLVEDASGNLVTTDTSVVTLTIGSGSAILGGVASTTAVGGIATFNDLLLSAAETTTFTASDGALTAAVSNAVTITAAPVAPVIPAQVIFTQQPVSTQLGSAISPAITVEVRDSNGRLVVNDTSAVTLSIAAGTGTLGGTLTVDAVAGVATFSDITISAAGSFTLKATDGGLNPATSTSFDVAVPGTIAPTITKSTLPLSGVAGTKLSSTVVISNLPAITGAGSVTTSIYASDDGLLTLLGTVTKTVSAKANKPYSISVPIKLLPASLAGTYSLVARTVDTSGNYRASDLGATLTVAAPIVTFSEIFTKATLTGAVVAGSKSKATATVKITNSGNVTSTGLTTIGIYASADGSTTDATLIATLVKKLSLRAGSSTSVSIPLKLLPSSLSGSYTLLTEVTNPGTAGSSATSSSTFTAALPFVSLSSSVGVVTPSTVSAGKTISIIFTLTNSGNINATGAASINIGLSSDGTTALAGSVTTVHSETIVANKSIVLHLKYVVPVGTTAGMYFPFVSLSQDGNSTQAIGSVELTVG